MHLARPEQLYTHPKKPDEQYPFRPSYRHFIKGGGKQGKGLYVECWDGKRCVTCAYTNPQKYDLEIEPNSWLAQFKSGFYVSTAGWTEEWYHNVKLYRDDNDPSKGTFFARERCQGRGCELCADGVERIFGNKNFITFSPNLWRTLLELQSDVAELYCTCGDRRFIPEYNCKNCSAIIIDVCRSCERCESEDIAVDDETFEAECQNCQETWSILAAANEGIMKEVNREHTCHECGEKALPKPLNVCMDGDCGGRPKSIFDMQLTLKVTGTKMDKKLHVLDWRFQEPDPRLFDPAYQGSDPEWAEKIAQGNAKVINLDQILKADDPDTQAQNLNVDNPFAVTRGASRAVPRHRS